MRPSTVPRASKTIASPSATASAQTKRAALSRLPRASSMSYSFANFSGYVERAPPKRADSTPGAPSSASISRPESSAIAAIPDAFA